MLIFDNTIFNKIIHSDMVLLSLIKLKMLHTVNKHYFPKHQVLLQCLAKNSICYLIIECLLKKMPSEHM